MKPDLIVITGAPGSGKSRLAQKLDRELYGYVRIDPDDVLQSFWEKTKDLEEYNREKVGIPKLWNIIEELLTKGVRLIVDTQIDEKYMKQLYTKFRVINIHCRAESTARRFYERELLSDGSEPDWLKSHMKTVYQLEKIAKDPIDVGQKIIEVDCADSYDPSIETIKEGLGVV